MSNNVNKLLERFEELQENMGPGAAASVPICRIDDEKGGYEVFLVAHRIHPDKRDDYASKLVRIN